MTPKKNYWSEVFSCSDDENLNSDENVSQDGEECASDMDAPSEKTPDALTNDSDSDTSDGAGSSNSARETIYMDSEEDMSSEENSEENDEEKDAEEDDDEDILCFSKKQPAYDKLLSFDDPEDEEDLQEEASEDDSATHFKEAVSMFAIDDDDDEENPPFDDEELDSEENSDSDENSEESGASEFVLPVIPAYERPSGAFGAGLLEELYPELAEENDSEVSDEAPQLVIDDSIPETSEEDSMNDEEFGDLDHWEKVMFELGMPVERKPKPQKAPEKEPEKEKSVQKASSNKPADSREPKESRPSRRSREPRESTGSDSAHGPRRPIPTESILNDDDFSSPENIFGEKKAPVEKTEEKPVEKKSERPSRRDRDADRGRNRDKNRDRVRTPEPAPDFEPEEVQEAPVPPRRRGRNARPEVAPVQEDASTIIGDMMANVVAEKTAEENARPNRRRRGPREDASPVAPASAPAPVRERSRKARTAGRPVFEEDDVFEEIDAVPADFQDVPEEPEVVEEPARRFQDDAPNGARSRRRRRSRSQGFRDVENEVEDSIEPVEEPVVEEIEEEVEEEAPRARRGRDRNRDGGRGRDNRSRRSSHDHFSMHEDDMDVDWGEDDDTSSDALIDEEDEVEEAPRKRQPRNRRRQEEEAPRSRKFGRRDERDDSDDFEDEEDHVFSEVEDEMEDEDDAWETDFSQQNISGWRDTISWIVNQNLKARNREPSSMAGRMNRPQKRGPRRK